jgi:four helix bundle protein
MKFEQLGVWKRASRLACNTYKAINKCKDFGFKDQVTRAAISIPSNIADKIAGVNFERACAALKR